MKLTMFSKLFNPPKNGAETFRSEMPLECSAMISNTQNSIVTQTTQPLAFHSEKTFHQQNKSSKAEVFYDYIKKIFNDSYTGLDEVLEGFNEKEGMMSQQLNNDFLACLNEMSQAQNQLFEELNSQIKSDQYQNDDSSEMTLELITSIRKRLVNIPVLFLSLIEKRSAKLNEAMQDINTLVCSIAEWEKIVIRLRLAVGMTRSLYLYQEESDEEGDDE